MKEVMKKLLTDSTCRSATALPALVAATMVAGEPWTAS